MKTFLILLLALLFCLRSEAQRLIKKQKSNQTQQWYNENNKSLNNLASWLAGDEDKAGVKTYNYNIIFNVDGNIDKKSCLPSVFKAGDIFCIGKPTNKFNGQQKTKIDEVFKKMRSNPFFDSASCNPVFKLLLCKAECVTTCIYPFEGELIKRLDALPKDDFESTIVGKNPIAAVDKKIGLTFRKNMLENILASDWLKINRKNYKGFNYQNCPLSECQIDGNCNCGVTGTPCGAGDDCNCYQGHENEFWDFYYELSSLYVALRLEYESFLAEKKFNDVKKINSLIERTNSVENQLETLVKNAINANKEWMFAWMWYTKGDLRLNPFGTSDTLALARHLRSRIRTIEADVSAYSVPNTTLSDFRTIHPALSYLTRELTFLKARLGQLPKLFEAYKKNIDSLSIKSDLLYKGEFYVSDPKQVIWMPSYDAMNNYEKFSEAYPEEISELDEMRPLVINLATKKKVVLTEDVKAIPNITGLERNIDPFFNELSKSKDIKLPLLVGISSFGSEKEFIPESTTSEFDKLITCLKKVKETLVLADWLSEQTAPPIEIKLEEEKEADYRTELVKPAEPKEKDGSVKVTYGIVEKIDDKETIVIRNEKYQQYELTRVAPAAGFVYHFKDRYASQYSDGKFSDVPFNRLDYVFGVKIYFAKTNVQYSTKTMRFYKLGKGYNYLRGNNWLNRTNLFLGLGTEKIFRNYYAGLGIDVFPWLQVQGGGNWYIQKRYALQNGTLVNTQDKLTSGGWYVSATLPAGLVSKVIKFINPF